MKKLKKLILITTLLAASVALSQVTVTAPTNNSTVGTPTQFIASAKSTNGSAITGMRIYVDGTSLFHTSNASLNTFLTLSAGPHAIVVQAWDATGQSYKASLQITVDNGNGIPPNAILIDNIDQMNGWKDCDLCAGPGGKGHPTPHKLTQHIASPSMDGQSAQFWIGGSRPYGTALWWRQLGAQPNASNFVYDTHFYSNNPGAAQALEFDANQALNGKRFVFGTECNIKGSHQWDIWDGKHWARTGIACSLPTAFKWHHLIWQFQRSGNNVVFVSFTLDGNTSYINRKYAAVSSGTKELNVAFQLDGNSREENYSFWLDKIKLYYW